MKLHVVDDDVVRYVCDNDFPGNSIISPIELRPYYADVVIDKQGRI